MHNHHNIHNNHNGQIRQSIDREQQTINTTVKDVDMGVNQINANANITTVKMMQGQRNRLPCIHKGTTKCTLQESNRCCACVDQRPHEPFYTKYVDGIGMVTNATRWDYYCPGCKTFWADAISRSGVAPQDTKIPHYPTHTRKAITPQNSGLSAMLASPKKLQSPLSTSTAGKPTLSKLTIPQSTRPLPVLTVHFKAGQQDQPKIQQVAGQKRHLETQPIRFSNPFQSRNVADLVARSQMVHRAVQQNYPRPVVHQSLQAPLQRANAILRSAGGDYPSPPMSSLSRGNSDYYSNEDPESSDVDSDASSDDGSIVGEDIAKETETFQSQRNHTRLATRALVRGDFSAAEAHFATAYAIASSSRWKSSSRSDRVVLAIKMAEAQSSQGNYDRAMRTLEDACEVAEEMSTNEYYYKVQLAMSEIGFKVADAAEKRRKRVMKSVEEEYGRDSELWREGNRIGQYAAMAALSAKAHEDVGEPARKRVNVMTKAKSDLSSIVPVKSEPIDVDVDEKWETGNANTVVEAMA